jgi:hypothetical protein
VQLDQQQRLCRFHELNRTLEHHELSPFDVNLDQAYLVSDAYGAREFVQAGHWDGGDFSIGACLNTVYEPAVPRVTLEGLPAHQTASQV